MRTLLIICLAYLSVSNGIEIDASNTRTSATFETRIDHFRPQSAGTAVFTYDFNTDYYQPGGPLYIYINDVRSVGGMWIFNGLMADIAEETNGAIYTFSTRYLGENRPTQNASFVNMQYLTVEQSLADIATFIHFLQSNPEIGSDVKVILWGSGYGGTMATWARKRYPHLVDGAWSSSGVFDVMLYNPSQYNQLEYIIGSTNSYECSDLLRNAFYTIDDLIQNGEDEYLQESLNLCHPVDRLSIFDIAAFYEYHVLFIMDYINRRHSHGILNFCRDMEYFSGDPFQSFARWLIHNYGTPNCFDHRFDGMIQRSSNIEWDVEGTQTGRRQWYHLQCTQIGSFLVAEEFAWLPGRIPIIYHIEKCIRTLGEQYVADHLISANINLIREFGSLNQSVSNVIYTNGAIDPWLHTGMQVSRDPNTVVLTIDTYAKSADLPSIHPGLDTPLLVQAKQQIRNQIIDWSFD